MTVFLNNLQRMFHKPSSWVYLILIPIVLNLGIVSLSIQQAQWVVGVKDDDRSAITQEFKDTFAVYGKVIEVNDAATVDESLKNSDYDIYVEFPQGYTDDVVAGKQPQITVIDRGDNNQTDSLKVEMRSFLGSVNALGASSGGDKAKFEEAFKKYADGKFDASFVNFDGGSSEEAAMTVTTLGYLAFGIVLMMSSSASLLLEDRLRGVYDRATLTPLKRWSYFTQYLFSMLLIGLAQLAIVMTVIPMMTPIEYGNTHAQTLGIVAAAAAFTLFAVSKSLLIYRFSKNALTAAGISSIIDLPLLMLGGALWPRDIMPEALQTIGQYSPVWWYLDAAELSVRGEGWATVLQPIGLLVALSLILLVIVFAVRTERTK